MPSDGNAVRNGSGFQRIVKWTEKPKGFDGTGKRLGGNRVVARTEAPDGGEKQSRFRRGKTLEGSLCYKGRQSIVTENEGQRSW